MERGSATPMRPVEAPAFTIANIPRRREIAAAAKKAGR
jgi:hypothetical protein